MQAVDGLQIKAQGTNVIVSWPSPGQWQNYVIQYRPDLNPGTPWTTLLFNTQPGIPDNYAANSQTVTTYTNFGAIPISTGSGGGSGTNLPPVPTLVAVSSEQAASIGESATLNDGLANAIPLLLYPPGFDTSEMTVFETLLPGLPVSESLQGDEALAVDGTESQSLTVGGVVQSVTTTTGATMGFYRVFQKPDFYYDYAGYTFSQGYEFLPIYLGVHPSIVKDVKLLVDGQIFPQTSYYEAQYDFGSPTGVQYTWGIIFNYDRLANGTHTLQLVTTIRKRHP